MLDAATSEAFDVVQDHQAAPRRRLVELDRRPRSEPAPQPTARPAPRRLEGDEMRAQIVAALEAIRPRLQRDGGDCEFVDIVDNVIRVRLSGACVGCQLSSMTMVGVRMKLTEALGFLVKVAPV